METNKNIYVIYSSQNIEVLQHLLFHLKPLEESANIVIWHDDPVQPNQSWKPQNPSQLQEANMFLLLVSDVFMHSEFIQQIEFKNVIDRYKEGKANVIPILIDNCPWDTEFNSDDYDFSFKELQVLPKDKKPISDWNSEDQAIEHVIENLLKTIAPTSKISGKKAAEEAPKIEVANELAKKQLRDTITDKKEISENIIKNTTNKVTDTKAVIETKEPLGETDTKEEQIALDFAEEVELNRIAEQKQLAEAAAFKNQEEEALKLEAEAVTKKNLAQENEKARLEADAKKKASEELKRQEELHDEKRAADEDLGDSNLEAVSDIDELENAKSNKQKNRLLLLIFAALTILGIWFFSDSDKGAKKSDTNSPDIEVSEGNEDGVSTEQQEDDSSNTVASSGKLSIGDTFEDGIVFEIDESGTSGKIAATKDGKTVTWNQATKSASELGEGWRLPTLAEQRIMYRRIGPGADNIGNFANEMYWSGTAFDENQARVLRFEDGNSSFHYNSRGTHRRFLYRAVRDFSE